MTEGPLIQLRVLLAAPASTRAVISDLSRRSGLDLDLVSGRTDAGMRELGLTADEVG